MAELKDIASAEDAAIWAHRIPGAKNSLTVVDAREIEDAFQARLKTLGGTANADIIDAPLPHSVDKSRLAHSEPRRFRDKYHVKFVAKQPCLICGRRPSDAHHLRYAQQHRALGRKVSDEFTVPLCRGHLCEVHRCGDEAAWWKNAGIDPTVSARALWLETHPLPTAQDGSKGATSTATIGT